jgi:hypothetical protein
MGGGLKAFAGQVRLGGNASSASDKMAESGAN